MSTTTQAGHHAFRHEAFLYTGTHQFLAGATAFIEDAQQAGEPVLVMVPEPNLDRLRAAVAGESDGGGHSNGVYFADMADVGRNPARIIPAWRRFAARHGGDGSRLRGIGEPVWPGRSPAELSECLRHESLVNVAFAGGSDFWLQCPYDVAALDPTVIEEVYRAHPLLVEDGLHAASAAYAGQDAGAAPFTGSLPPPPGHAVSLTFDERTLRRARRFVKRHGEGAGLSAKRKHDLLLAATEVVTNSVKHGGGKGSISVWFDDDAAVCEVRDSGHIRQPLAGRELPSSRAESGRGLWLVNQVCDLVQVRSSPAGTAVRMRVRRR